MDIVTYALCKKIAAGAVSGISGIELNIRENDVKKATAINIIASGSSKNAGEMAKDYMEMASELPVRIFSASEYITNRPNINNNDIKLHIVSI